MVNAAQQVIAVDGPVAAGKTTASTAVAAELGLTYVESGQTYRLVAHQALQEHVPLNDEDELSALCARMLTRAPIDVYDTDGPTARALSMPNVTSAVKQLAWLPKIRTGVTELTRTLVGQLGPAIVEGQDIGRCLSQRCRKDLSHCV
jgi:CMP/dCMP kinase